MGHGAVAGWPQLVVKLVFKMFFGEIYIFFFFLEYKCEIYNSTVFLFT